MLIPSFFFFFPIVRGTWWWWPWEGGGGTFPELRLKSTASGIRAQKRELPDGGSKGFLCSADTSKPAYSRSFLSLSCSFFLLLSLFFLPSLRPFPSFLLFLPLWSALFVKSRTVPRLTLRSINHLELFSKCFRFEKTQTTLGQPLFLFLLHC